MFSELDDRALILRNLLDVSPPSVCGIFRTGPSCTLQHCGREEEGRRREPDSNVVDAVSLKFVFFHLAAGLLMFLVEPSAQRSEFHTVGGGGNWTPNSPMLSLKSVFFLIANGLLLLLLELSAQRSDFQAAGGGGNWTPNSPMLFLKSVFFFLAAGPPLLFMSV